MTLFQRTDDAGPEGFEGVVGELVQAIRRSFTGVVVDHLEDMLAVPARQMCLVGRHVHIPDGGEVHVVDLLLFHVTHMRYVALTVHAGRFDAGLVDRCRRVLGLVDVLIRVPEVHRPTVGALLCTDAGADQDPGPVVVTLYEDVEPDRRTELPTGLELAEVVSRCLDFPAAPTQPA